MVAGAVPGPVCAGVLQTSTSSPGRDAPLHVDVRNGRRSVDGKRHNIWCLLPGLPQNSGNHWRFESTDILWVYLHEEPAAALWR